MTNVEGFLFMVILFGIIACLIGAVVLCIAYATLKRTKIPIIRTGIITLILVFGFLRLMPLDAPMLLLGALASVVPMAVLVHPFVFPDLFPGRTNDTPRFARILLCYILVSAVGFFLPFIIVASGLSMMPEIYWHTPLSNGAVYACVIIFDVGLAEIFYRVMGRKDVGGAA